MTEPFLFLMTYDFSCKTCGVSFEITMPISALSRAKCSACGSTELRRIYSMPKVVIYNEDRFTRQLSPKGKQIWDKSKQQIGL